MWAFGIGRRNVNPCCGIFIPNPQLAGTWPLGADANCMMNDVSFILQSLICLLCKCGTWPPYDVTAGDCGSFTLQQVIAELWFSIGLYPEQFCSGLILGGYGTMGEWITLEPGITSKQKWSQQLVYTHDNVFFFSFPLMNDNNRHKDLGSSLVQKSVKSTGKVIQQQPRLKRTLKQYRVGQQQFIHNSKRKINFTSFDTEVEPKSWL